MRKIYTLCAFVVLLLFLGLLLTGCNKSNSPSQKDAFVEKWRMIAKQSQGHSPPAQSTQNPDADPRNLENPEGYEDLDTLFEEKEVDRPLPKTLVSLDMHKASLVAVLKALARIVDVSIIISPTIEFSQRSVGTKRVSGNQSRTQAQIQQAIAAVGHQGQAQTEKEDKYIEQVVTLHVNNKPWDEVFLGLIKTHGLSFRWQGEILSVITIDDIVKDTVMLAAKSRRLMQQVLVKKAEPRITRVIKIRYSSAANIAQTINTLVFKSDAKSSGGGSKAQKTRSSDEFTTLIQLNKDSFEREFRGVGEGEGESVTSGDAETKLIYNVPGDVSVDTDTNTIVVQAPRSVMKIVYYLVNKLDKPRAQIRIKCYIIETDSDTMRELGVQWGGNMDYQNSTNDRTMFYPGGTMTYDTDTSTWTPNYSGGRGGYGYGINFPLTSPQASTMGLSLGYLFGDIAEDYLEAQLSALETEDRVNILSSPTLITLENKEAIIQDGVEVPYPVETDDGYEVDWAEALISLRVTPQIVGDNFLRLQVQVLKDEVDETRSVLGYPYIKKKKTESMILCRDGETIVLSGLTKRQTDKNDDGVPWLKDVPALGWLFKHQLNEEELTEIMVFITPLIMQPVKPNDIQKSFELIEDELEEEGLVDQNHFDTIDID